MGADKTTRASEVLKAKPERILHEILEPFRAARPTDYTQD
jgi:hypothetical protein